MWTTISLRSLWDMKIRGSVELCSFTCSCWSSCSIKIPSYFRVKNHLSTSTGENVWRVAPCLLAGWHVLIYLIILALLEFGNDKSKLWLRCLRNRKSWSICIPYVYFWVAFKDVFWKHGNLLLLSATLVQVRGIDSFHLGSMLGMGTHFTASGVYCKV